MGSLMTSISKILNATRTLPSSLTITWQCVTSERASWLSALTASINAWLTCKKSHQITPSLNEWPYWRDSANFECSFAPSTLRQPRRIIIKMLSTKRCQPSASSIKWFMICTTYARITRGRLKWSPRALRWKNSWPSILRVLSTVRKTLPCQIWWKAYLCMNAQQSSFSPF